MKSIALTLALCTLPALAHAGHDPETVSATAPGPEMDVLKELVGTWDAAVEIYGDQGQVIETSSGTEVNALACGGLWLVTEFTGVMAGEPFEGRGLLGFDRAKQTYTGAWVDSLITSLALTDATYDPTARAFTTSMTGKNPDGSDMKMRAVDVTLDADHRTWTAYMTAPDGSEFVGMKINYTRRAAP